MDSEMRILGGGYSNRRRDKRQPRTISPGPVFLVLAKAHLEIYPGDLHGCYHCDHDEVSNPARVAVRVYWVGLDRVWVVVLDRAEMVSFFLLFVLMDIFIYRWHPKVFSRNSLVHLIL